MNLISVLKYFRHLLVNFSYMGFSAAEAQVSGSQCYRISGFFIFSLQNFRFQYHVVTESQLPRPHYRSYPLTDLGGQ